MKKIVQPGRLDGFGEAILAELNADHIQHLMTLQARDQLYEEVLVNLRRAHLKTTAA